MTAFEPRAQALDKIGVAALGFALLALLAHNAWQVQGGDRQSGKEIRAHYNAHHQQNERDEGDFNAPGRVYQHRIPRVIPACDR